MADIRWISYPTDTDFWQKKRAKRYLCGRTEPALKENYLKNTFSGLILKTRSHQQMLFLNKKFEANTCYCPGIALKLH